METTGLSSSEYFIFVFLLQMITLSSEQFTVSAQRGTIVVPVSEVAELSCQLSPPQSAEHMEVRWFQDRYTQPVHLYKGGKDLYGETISKYVERIDFLKEAIGEGKVTVRILNVNVDDNGQYHCLFKDGDFYDEAIIELKVTATSLQTQIFVHPPNLKGITVECYSIGWFPEPQMEWRNTKEEIIPPTSISHSQDSAKLFNMKMTLLLTGDFRRDITCCLQNPVTGQRERTSIILSGRCCSKNSPVLMGLLIIMSSASVICGLITYLHLKKRVPVSDPNSPLYIMWLEDISVILCMLMVVIIVPICFIYFRLRAYRNEPI
ncbi:PREDICTED: selection and upkeep of intraepithelial T-cells protein 1-like [Elephantulus edwardii]|uniref:selection and upkeep of intraepithelial T-cells protein 1-like n=1 Tax=Elephantulus edwardii TaxID=28737 RepID=UPI0003F08379|nr:PREDICTED: selection and upkeep of intraepithelial T-cells protein 1-like [Elephantulus edwardii]